MTLNELLIFTRVSNEALNRFIFFKDVFLYSEIANCMKEQRTTKEYKIVTVNYFLLKVNIRGETNVRICDKDRDSPVTKVQCVLAQLSPGEMLRKFWTDVCRRISDDFILISHTF